MHQVAASRDMILKTFQLDKIGHLDSQKSTLQNMCGKRVFLKEEKKLYTRQKIIKKKHEK